MCVIQAPRPDVAATCLALALLIVGSAQAQERFNLLVVGHPDLTSTAELHGDQLVITDVMGQTFVYVRAREFDSRDGEYLGFHNVTAGQTVRFPVNRRGSMLIGDAPGGGWRRSRQQIVPVGGPRAVGPAGHFDHAHRHPHPPFWAPTAALVAPGEYWLAHINQSGELVVFGGYGNQWHRLPDVRASGLFPGGPVVLVRDPSGPGHRLLTISPAGILVDAREPRIQLARNIAFVPGGSVAVGPDQDPDSVFGVDAQGRLVRVELRRGHAHVLDIAEVRWLPGQPLAVVPARDAGHLVLLVDRGGRLVEVAAHEGRAVARGIADSFVPSSPVAAGLSGEHGAVPYACAVDVVGELQLFERRGGGSWRRERGPPAHFLPGSHVALSPGDDLPLISVIGPDGRLMVWQHSAAGWTLSVVAAGLTPGSPVVLPPGYGHVFALDHLGQLAVGHAAAEAWDYYLCREEWDFVPRLLRRSVIANPVLRPVSVTLENSSDDPLIIQVMDVFNPMPPVELEIPAAGAVQYSFERDAGSTIEEVYLEPGPGPVPGTWTERAEQISVPPRARYQLVAWAQRVTYQYIDRRPNRPAGTLEDFDLRSNVSLGVIAVPPGDSLLEGARIDILAEAAALQSPGAAAWFTQLTGAP